MTAVGRLPRLSRPQQGGLQRLTPRSMRACARACPPTLMGCRALPFGSRGGARWPTARGGLLKGTAHGTACPASSIYDRSCMRDRHSRTQSGVKPPRPYSCDRGLRTMLNVGFIRGFSPPKTVRQRLRSHEWMATGMSASLSTGLRCDDSLASNYAGTLVLTAARPHCKPSLLDGVLSQALRHLASQHRGSAPMR